MISGQALETALPKIPVRELNEPIEAPKIASGKVREIFDLEDSILLVATDRISAFDVVLPGGIPGKGAILTQLSRFWFEKTKGIAANHLIPNEEAFLKDQLGLSADGLLPGKPALLFQGTTQAGGGAGVTLGDGLRCAGGSIQRLSIRILDAGGGASWGPGLATSAGWSGGAVRQLQVWYRDPAGSGATSNLSNGLGVLFCP